MALVRRMIVSGRVQGVGYRAATQQTARELGLVGTVRNLPDGRVRIEAEGETAALDALIAWCRRGPALARVDQIEVEEGVSAGHTSFDVIR